MTARVVSSQRRPKKVWWLIAAILFTVCVLVQMPAAWMAQKYMPNSPYLQHISGNLWQGSAIWQLPQARRPLTGTMTWSWQPWQLFLGQLGARVTVTSGQSQLAGDAALGRQGWRVADVSGKLSPDTLAAIVDWQLPEAPIQVNNVFIDTDKERGFVTADGQLTWVGGQLGYPSGAKTYQITLPAMRAELSAEQKDEQSLLHANLLDNQDKRLGDLYLDSDNMLDVNLTQRLLENMPDYKGQAPLDTPVVSVRQPLLAGLGAQ